ncbi:MAG: family 16 glycoside hydrolase [Planctomycetota bacterium]
MARCESLAHAEKVEGSPTFQDPGRLADHSLELPQRIHPACGKHDSLAAVDPGKIRHAAPITGDFRGLAGYEVSGPEHSTVMHSTVMHPEFGKLTHVPRTADAEKPRGTWNHYKILADGSTVTLEINGQVVNRAADRETTPGNICLTAEGNEIECRNVTLVPLEE